MWYYNYYIAILIISLIFFIISINEVKILLSIIIIIIIGYYYYNKIIEFDNVNIQNQNNIIKSINDDIKNRKYVNNENFYLKKFNKNIKYLINDKVLLDIILNIKFTMKYDYEKYTNIINYIDNLYKIYMYILANRYDIRDYFTSFLSLRDTIIKEMYSIYIILPMKMEYYYGFNSFNELKKSINDFINHSRKLIIVLERYAKLEKNIYYLEDSKYKYKELNNYMKYEVY